MNCFQKNDSQESGIQEQIGHVGNIGVEIYQTRKCNATTDRAYRTIAEKRRQGVRVGRLGTYAYLDKKNCNKGL